MALLRKSRTTQPSQQRIGVEGPPTIIAGPGYAHPADTTQRRRPTPTVPRPGRAAIPPLPMQPPVTTKPNLNRVPATPLSRDHRFPTVPRDGYAGPVTQPRGDRTKFGSGQMGQRAANARFLPPEVRAAAPQSYGFPFGRSTPPAEPPGQVIGEGMEYAHRLRGTPPGAPTLKHYLPPTQKPLQRGEFYAASPVYFPPEGVREDRPTVSSKKHKKDRFRFFRWLLGLPLSKHYY